MANILLLGPSCVWDEPGVHVCHQRPHDEAARQVTAWACLRVVHDLAVARVPRTGVPFHRQALEQRWAASDSATNPVEDL